MYNNNDDWNNQFYNSSNFENNEIITIPPKRKKHKFTTYLSLVLITSLVTGAAVGGGMYYKFSKELEQQVGDLQKSVALSAKSNGNSTAATLTSADSLKAATLLNTSAGDLSISEIAKKVGPSIVGVTMSVQNSRSSGFYGFGTPSSSSSEGSGIIISSDGYIMTNYHVVSYADPKSGIKNTTLTVYLPDKRQAKATFIGGDEDNDLAVIKINLTNLPVAELGSSSEVEVGDTAVAIGNPLGMEFAGSVTVGVISALNRQVDTGNGPMDLFQTDAAINPGNSGGALVNSKGQVIGINSAKISKNGIEGLGFAIPTDTAKPIIEQLRTYGYVKGKPLMGISTQEVPERYSEMYGIPVGLYVVEVTPGGAAANAGIKAKDIIIKLDGKKVKTNADIDAIKKLHKAGDTVDVVVSRNGQQITLKLTFTEANQ
ncbi:S1C family serine protease [Ruminiclostridium cellulolyticum]|uniref:Peptidase S1 and S6 chymotrypsin/Hap n=1 Tax=Ruminiclostridium cellulolyticum (strain ATCC 35319 / DSM 5812 / JCM 6584 / H10) TaxID=394503 RepID=B8I8V2_RUMCH|nr:trypsin-like peptidase domain-containing protein [Ruminiclostridium cellulolyticum]ACL77284.1 peptidase S1 and S6 chymotrypsin/Hap [Ruminiclostridium cellulolyticum H10]